MTIIFLSEFRQIEGQVFQFRSREILSLPQSKPSVSTAPSSEGAEELIFALAYSIEGATGSINRILFSQKNSSPNGEAWALLS